MFNQTEVKESQELNQADRNLFDPRTYISESEKNWLLDNSAKTINFQGDTFAVVWSSQRDCKNWTVLQWQDCDLQLARMDEFVSIQGAFAHVNRQIKSWLLDLLNEEVN